MGAWGLGLFQSDFDYDILKEIEDLLHLDPDKDGSLRIPKDVAALRKKLNDTGIQMVMNKYLGKIVNPPKEPDWHPAAYAVVIFTVVCIEQGCTVPQKLLDFTSKAYEKVGLQRDGIPQVDNALKEYEPGKQWDCGSLGLRDTIAAGKTDESDLVLPGTLMNTTSPEWGQGHKVLFRSLSLIVKDGYHGDDACGGCGAQTMPRGGPLMKCGACKKRKYCGVECQKKHWHWHKQLCGKELKDTLPKEGPPEKPDTAQSCAHYYRNEYKAMLAGE
ncbi:hypothetical protein P152DRAFT_477436 [Eremomyces bilateralis CBS 781.70]|uniref:MYND-type domain-containing protein n=1 Tax=Eremomyces bilateralis CBS 781.70 TaxID=1392243 RepID=A0A6G1FRK0_9PEZI|nr:uncharacterized protein P152DRAFT_477436 [Eremomyces bilateralis CBS 781.70]KAF1808292.1 hypothetical protein P152DRAFT_477436 [Eremomyces bilateralis CBS 781.70]